MILFPKALLLARSFPKIVKGQFFYWIYIKKFQIFLKNFPTICIFRQNSGIIRAGLLKFV